MEGFALLGLQYLCARARVVLTWHLYSYGVWLSSSGGSGLWV